MSEWEIIVKDANLVIESESSGEKQEKKKKGNVEPGKERSKLIPECEISPTPKKSTSSKTISSRGPFPSSENEEIVVDGSNVARFGCGRDEANKEQLELMIKHLKKKGFTPVVISDANLPHLMFKSSDANKRYDLWNDWVKEWEKDGVVINRVTRGDADPHILDYAEQKNLKIVSTDAFNKKGEAENHSWVNDEKRLYIFNIINDTITWK